MSTSKSKKQQPEQPERPEATPNLEEAPGLQSSTAGTELMAANAASQGPTSRDLMIQAIAIDALVERVNLVKEAIKRCRVEGQPHGTIPGIKQPSPEKLG